MLVKQKDNLHLPFCRSPFPNNHPPHHAIHPRRLPFTAWWHRRLKRKCTLQLRFSHVALAVHAVSLVRQVPFSDWELRPEDIVICKRANGEDWQIGNGAFGQVYKATLNGVQTVAVKVVRGQDPREQVRPLRCGGAGYG